MKSLKTYLEQMVKAEASDLFFTTAAYPSMKVHGEMVPIEEERMAQNAVKEMANRVMSEEQRADFHKQLEMNMAISEPGLGRFRVNIFIQRGEYGMVIRHIKSEIPDLASLGVPQILKDTVMEKRGLILMVGATGTGKSTTLASLIDYRNRSSSGHIITIEDPIEFIHSHQKSIINQREVGVDTLCYNDALENTLRQAPDVILIGEIRTQKTMEHAIAFAETGHLCLSTLHANNANQALDRIINFFPEERHKQLLLDLSLNLRAIVSQRLVPTQEGKRVAAFEIMLGTPLICDLIRRGEVHELKEVMQKSENLGMQTFDSALYHIFKKGLITEEEALRNADSANNLRLRISLDQGVSENPQYELEIKSTDAEKNKTDIPDIMPQFSQLNTPTPKQK